MALETVATLCLMCDGRDLGHTLGDDAGDSGERAENGGESAPRAPGSRSGRGPQPGYDPTVFVFDNIPGGVGLSERIYEQSAEIVARTRQLLRSCACTEGCPLCVGAADMGIAPALTGLRATRKQAALRLLDLLMQ
jgi:DEAD/DEAH box helicase domain-containing protein